MHHIYVWTYIQHQKRVFLQHYQITCFMCTMNGTWHQFKTATSYASGFTARRVTVAMAQGLLCDRPMNKRQRHVAATWFRDAFLYDVWATQRMSADVVATYRRSAGVIMALCTVAAAPVTRLMPSRALWSFPGKRLSMSQLSVELLPSLTCGHYECRSLSPSLRYIISMV